MKFFCFELFHFQVLGTLLIYVLFMVEELRKAPVENMDDVIYWVNGTYRLLEFLVALCVVAYGVSETVFGEWTVMGSTIVLIHSYYNVWLRAQLGWQSFLLRRDAVNKIKSLPTASHQQLQQHNDICSICYQVCVDVRICVCDGCPGIFFVYFCGRLMVGSVRVHRSCSYSPLSIKLMRIICATPFVLW